MPFAVRQRSEAVWSEKTSVPWGRKRGQRSVAEGQRTRATCNLTVDCASFTSSSDIAQPRYHGNRQEQKSVADPLSTPPPCASRFSLCRRDEANPRTAKTGKRNKNEKKEKKRRKREGNGNCRKSIAVVAVMELSLLQRERRWNLTGQQLADSRRSNRPNRRKFNFNSSWPIIRFFTRACEGQIEIPPDSAVARYFVRGPCIFHRFLSKRSSLRAFSYIYFFSFKYWVSENLTRAQIRWFLRLTVLYVFPKKSMKLFTNWSNFIFVTYKRAHTFLTSCHCTWGGRFNLFTFSVTD